MRSRPKSSLQEFDLACDGDWSFLAGVDEAGRGALAGPVVAAAVFIGREFYARDVCRELEKVVDDSKRLSAAGREGGFERLHALVRQGAIFAGVGEGTVEEIARLNILGATRLAMRRAIEAVLSVDGFPREMEFRGESLELFDGEPGNIARVRLLVDGLPLKPFPFLHNGVVKGDGKSLAIASASILAKVTRDRIMTRLDRLYPHYQFARHKGYGTGDHRRALRENGPSPQHRRHFLRKILPNQ